MSEWKIPMLSYGDFSSNIDWEHPIPRVLCIKIKKFTVNSIRNSQGVSCGSLTFG